jgi:NTE family protein
MLLNGELHFDGGLLNNLPVDIMRKIVGHRGNVVAIELIGNMQDEHKYEFPPILTFWQTFLSKINMGPKYKYPRFIDTFLKSLLVGSSLKSQLNSTAANMFVSLDLSRFPMLYSNKGSENKILEEGYNSTVEQIKNRKK